MVNPAPHRLTLWIKRAGPSPPADNYRPTEAEGGMLLPLESTEGGFTACWITELSVAQLKERYAKFIVPVNAGMDGMLYEHALDIRRGFIQPYSSPGMKVGKLRASEGADVAKMRGTRTNKARLRASEGADGVRMVGARHKKRIVRRRAHRNWTWIRKRPWPTVEWNDDLDLGVSP